jgi:peptidyl-dipeptidase A
MWSQNWEALLDLLLPNQKMLNLTSALRSRNYTTVDMVRHAEDFYTSLGLEPMTHSFWMHSQIERPTDNNGTCHGTAANMYQPGDYRYSVHSRKLEHLIDLARWSCTLAACEKQNQNENGNNGRPS